MTSELTPADIGAIVDGNRGGGFFGGDGLYAIIVLFILMAMMNGGWGGIGNGGNALPWMMASGTNTNNDVQRGFDQAALTGAINNVGAAVNAISPQLCSGFAGVNATVNSGFANAETAANARQMANMNQAFAAQTAVSSQLSGLSDQLASCCCENRLATANLTGVVQTEAAANRYADATNTRDIIENCNRNNQAILDKLCQLELDGVRSDLAAAQRENVGLQNQLNMATMQASQNAQNAFIAQGLANEVDALYNRLNNCPVPTVPVYGRQPIFTCSNNGCGCGA